ncbi:oligosaccharide flippase family protein [Cytobacillus gottheilii]|uniref:Oligosaccharide flippase family protein n=1 Tax=Cytobacillus gottheilii TaxID=859144 RepID=A0ABX8FA98_9BACI|nr:oligosaccharide flippase family protein [Cytobacillus gottheilii]QVY61289.1 oligosaccharide flippase family protein [Cytobacillus gottheilii]
MSQMKSGAILSYLSIFITILIALLYTPIMIRLLGQSEYGLYAMVGSIAAYLSVMDMGLGNAVIRYNARNRAIGDKESESRLNGMFIVLYSVIGILTLFIGVILYNSIYNLFGASLTVLELEKAKIMVIILIINFAVSFPLSVFGSIMQAYERFAIVKGLGIFRSLISPLIILPFLFMGYGSVTMVVITTIVNISCLLFNVYYCFEKLKIRFYFGKIDYQLLKEILGYSFFIFLGVIVDQINWNTGQIILGVVSGTVAVAVYAIAMQFIRLYMQFSTSISGVFLPRVTMMVANNASNLELTNMMIKFGRLQYIIMSYILSGFILYGYPFISIWAGQDYSQAYYMTLLIMIPFTIDLIQNICLSILQAKNFQRFRSLVLIMIAILNVTISIPLAQNYGGVGVALGTGVSYFLGAGIIMNIYYQRKLGLNIPLFWKHIIFMSIPVLLSLLTGFGINHLIAQNSIGFLVLKIVLFSVIFGRLMWLIGCNNYERGLFISINKRMAKIIRGSFKSRSL